MYFYKLERRLLNILSAIEKVDSLEAVKFFQVLKKLTRWQLFIPVLQLFMFTLSFLYFTLF